MKKPVSANDLLAQLQQALAKKHPDAPEGWQTTEGWAKKWGVSRGHADTLLRNGLKKGLVKRGKFGRPQGRATYFYGGA